MPAKTFNDKVFFSMLLWAQDYSCIQRIYNMYLLVETMAIFGTNTWYYNWQKQLFTGALLNNFSGRFSKIHREVLAMKLSFLQGYKPGSAMWSLSKRVFYNNFFTEHVFRHSLDRSFFTCIVNLFKSNKDIWLLHKWTHAHWHHCSKSRTSGKKSKKKSPLPKYFSKCLCPFFEKEEQVATENIFCTTESLLSVWSIKCQILRNSMTILKGQLVFHGRRNFILSINEHVRQVLF